MRIYFLILSERKKMYNRVKNTLFFYVFIHFDTTQIVYAAKTTEQYLRKTVNLKHYEHCRPLVCI